MDAKKKKKNIAVKGTKFSRHSTNLVSLSNLFLKYLHKQGLERSKSDIKLFSLYKLWKLAYKSLVKILPFC